MKNLQRFTRLPMWLSALLMVVFVTGCGGGGSGEAGVHCRRNGRGLTGRGGSRPFSGADWFFDILRRLMQMS